MAHKDPPKDKMAIGYMLMGGSDVCPETYGEKALKPEWNGDRIRDDYEIALLRAFARARKPDWQQRWRSDWIPRASSVTA